MTLAFACLLVLLLVAAGLMIYLASGHVSLGTLGAGLLAILPLSVLSFYVQAPRLAYLCGLPVSTFSAYVANSVSATFFLLLPGRSSELLKPVVLNLRDNLPVSKGIAALVVERFLDTICVIGLTVAAISANTSGRLSGVQNNLLIPAACAGMVLIAFAVASLKPQILFLPLRYIPWPALKQNIIDAIFAFQKAGRPIQLLVPACLTLASWLASYVNVLVASYVLGPYGLSPGQGLVVLIAGVVGMVITVVPGGIGTFEAATIAAMGAFGYPVSDALVVAVSLRVASLLPAVPCTFLAVAAHWISFVRHFEQRNDVES